MPSKNDVAWQSLFDTHHILTEIDANGFFEISSASINELREARLMTKFDHHIQLPTVFKDNGLSIQPNTRGTYLIGRFSSYVELPTDEEIPIEPVPFPAGIDTINPQDLYSESAALLCAYNTGIIESVLQQAVSLTVLGRMSTGRFEYLIEDNSNQPFQINVRNSQCEIDAGFEGSTVFGLVEAKNETVNDFLVRQLYYPFRLWTEKVQKPVVPIFLSYSNDVFSFYVYRFNDLRNYNSIELIGQRRYQIAEREIDLQDIVTALQRIRVQPEPDGVPFPQADSFSRVVDLLTQIHHAGVITQEEITTNHAFDSRQTQYYTNAGRYLGLIVRNASRGSGVSYSLTPRGSNIMSMQPAVRNLALVETMLEHSVFNEAITLYLNQAHRPELNQVREIMENAQLGLDIEGNTTIRRRAQTVLAWLDWIMRLTRQ